MRIVLSLTFSMMFTVNSCPLFSNHTRCQPQPETKKMTRDGMQFKRSVCRMTVQINRYTRNRNMRKY